MVMMSPFLSVMPPALKAWAAAKPKIWRLYVFGSRVAGINKNGMPVRNDSDLDIAVVLSPGIHDQTLYWMFDAKSWRAELATFLPYPLQLELMQSDDADLQRYVENTGVLLLDRS